MPTGPQGRALTVDELKQLALFQEVAEKRPALLEKIKDVRRRRFRHGDVICREGEKGDCAWFVLEGQVELHHSPRPWLARGWLGRLWDRFDSWMKSVTRSRHQDDGNWVRQSPPPPEVGAGERRKGVRTDLPLSWLLLDSPRPFPAGRPERLLGPGSLFEEETCANAATESRRDAAGNKLPGDYPRSVAARARGEVELLDLDMAALRALREASPVKDQIDAALKKATAAVRMGAGDPVDEEELRTLEIAGMKPFEKIAKLLSERPGSVVRRTYRAGDIVCRQGEFGSTAFILVKGSVEVRLERVMERVDSDKASEERRPYIPTDIVDLPVSKPIATMGAGELFGEGTCLNFYPRSATVVALEDCSMLEILRNVLDLLKRYPPYKDKLEDDYRKRALNNHLRGVPLFKNLPEEAIEALKAKAQIVNFSRLDQKLQEKADPADYIICREGDVADAFYLVRSGTIKVTKQGPGGEIVLPYLSRGDFLGEIGLLLGGVRSATCEALDRVELVKIAKEDFDGLIEDFPEIKVGLRDIAVRRRQRAERAQMDLGGSNLKQFVGQGLMMAKDLLIIDLNSCTRCDACVKACADTHDGISRLPRVGVRFDDWLITAACRSCSDPLCMVGCPVGSIRRKDSKEILIEDWCIGCNRCVEQCPYGAIEMHFFRVEEKDPAGGARFSVKKQAAGCDLCSGYEEPNCVYACPHDSLKRVNPRQHFGDSSHRVAGRTKAWSRENR